MQKINISNELSQIKKIESLERKLFYMRQLKDDGNEEIYNKLTEQVEEMKNGFKQKNKIQKIAHEVEGRAWTRLLNVNIFYNDIIEFLKKFEDLKIGKRKIRIEFIYDQDAEKVPRAYKYQKMDTILHIEIIGGKVYITDIRREESDPSISNRFQRIKHYQKKQKIS